MITFPVSPCYKHSHKQIICTVFPYFHVNERFFSHIDFRRKMEWILLAKYSWVSVFVCYPTNN